MGKLIIIEGTDGSGKQTQTELLCKKLKEIKGENNVKKIYDVRPLIEKYSSFKDLINIKGLFKQVKIDKGGYGISWNDNIDLSCNTLWNEGRLI